MLTGKYMDIPAALDDTNRDRAIANLQKPRGRMDTRGWGGTLYRYRTEAAQDAMQEYSKLAKANKMSLTELSLRWCRQRDLITTTLLGHTSMNQLKETLDFFTKKDPLPEDLMWEIEYVAFVLQWLICHRHVILGSYSRFFAILPVVFICVIAYHYSVAAVLVRIGTVKVKSANQFHNVDAIMKV